VRGPAGRRRDPRDAEPCLKHSTTRITGLGRRARGAQVPRSQVGRYGVVRSTAAEGGLHTVTDMVENRNLGRSPRTSRSSGATCSPQRFSSSSTARTRDRAGDPADRRGQRNARNAPRGRLSSSEGDYYDTGTVPVTCAPTSCWP